MRVLVLRVYCFKKHGLFVQGRGEAKLESPSEALVEGARLQEVWWSGKQGSVEWKEHFHALGILLVPVCFVSQAVAKASCSGKHPCKMTTSTSLCISLHLLLLSVLSESKGMTGWSEAQEWELVGVTGFQTGDRTLAI